MLKAIVAKIDNLPASVANLYEKQTSGPFKGKYRLAVEPVDGVELLDATLLRKEESRLWGALEKKLVNDAVTAAVALVGGNHALLSPHLAERARVDRATLAVTVVGEDGENFYNNRGELGTMGDLVADLKKRPAYARAFDAVPAELDAVRDAPFKPQNPWGEGTLTEHLRKFKAAERTAPQKLQIVGNPFCRATFNLTAQGLITRADPTRAAQLRAEAESVS